MSGSEIWRYIEIKGGNRERARIYLREHSRSGGDTVRVASVHRVAFLRSPKSSSRARVVLVFEVAVARTC